MVGMALAGDPRGYYRALGVERTASAEDIKAAFRRQAKGLHPDRGGGTADKETFRRLMKAYEALRDPQLRLRYDWESLEAERGTLASGRACETPPATEAGDESDWLQQAVQFCTAHALALLAGALVLVSAVAVLGWIRAMERGQEVADLARRLQAESATASAELADRKPPRVYRTEFRFPAGVAELNPSARNRLAAITADLRRQIEALPADSEWLIGVDGVIERAADGDGLLVAAWELALLRVGVTAQYLVGEGIPAERVSVGFHAGALAPGRGQSHGVALSLFCCLDTPLGG
jgi:curved DNA-binding protein CbpA